jgi:hypothetical protein
LGPGNRGDAGIQGGGVVAVTPSFAGSEASAFSRMRAFTTWRARCLSFWINVLSRSRSSPLSFTTYFFTAACFAVTMRLRRCGAIDSEIHAKINDAGY